MEHTFREDELKMLARLVGKRLKYIAGPNLWHALTAPSVYIVTEGLSMSLDASSEELEFNGEWEDFSEIHLSIPNDSEIDAAVSSGYAYKKHSGEKILSVKVIADKITGQLDGNNNLNYLSHSGVILEFADGFISIMKHDHHQPILKVVYSQDTRPQDIPTPSHRFEEDLTQVFIFSRTLIPVD